MSDHSIITGFPLRASDQADIIAIYLELIGRPESGAAGSEAASHPPAEPNRSVTGPWLPDDPS